VFRSRFFQSFFCFEAKVINLTGQTTAETEAAIAAEDFNHTRAEAVHSMTIVSGLKSENRPKNEKGTPVENVVLLNMNVTEPDSPVQNLNVTEPDSPVQNLNVMFSMM